MIPYMIVMVIIIGCAIFVPKNFSWYLRTILFLLLLLFCGARIEVGPDWFSYTLYQKQLVSSPVEIDFASEFSFTLLNIASEATGWGIVGVNLVTASIFLWGLFSIAARTPYPWLAIAVAMCYYIPALPMGIIRQAAAIGIIYVLIAYWDNLNIWQRILIVIISVTFHLSAVIIIAIVFIDWKIEIWKRFIVIIFSIGVIYFSGIDIINLFSDYSDRYITGSSGVKIETTAAGFHWLLIAVPAMWYLYNRNSINFLRINNNFMYISSIAAISLILVMPVSSAAVTRLAMYFSYLPIVVGGCIVEYYKSPFSKIISKFGILISSTLILVIWLTFAENSSPYKPYKNFFTEKEWKVKMYVD